MEYLNEDEKFLNFAGFLNGELNSDEVMEFEKKLSRSEELKKEFENFRAMWESLSKVAAPADLKVDRSFENVLKRIENNKAIKGISRVKAVSKNIYHWEIFNRKREMWGWTVRLAAMIVLAVLSYQVIVVDHSSGISNVNEVIENQVYSFYVPKGKKMERILPDGTKVFLNSDSKLTYDDSFNVMQRSVTLEGEAYFEVAHNADKPFYVVTDLTGVKVLGTKFNVYVRDEDFSLAVVEGRVAAFHKASHKNTVLVKNEMVESHGSSGLSNPMKVDIAQFLDWRNNKLTFRNEPLEKVMREIELTFNVKSSFKDDSLRNRKLTGSFDATSLDDILTAISISLDVDLEKSGNSVLIQ